MIAIKACFEDDVNARPTLNQHNVLVMTIFDNSTLRTSRMEDMNTHPLQLQCEMLTFRKLRIGRYAYPASLVQGRKVYLDFETSSCGEGCLEQLVGVQLVSSRHTLRHPI
jgi:hypothetical protein